jgi:hypothetical protein
MNFNKPTPALSTLERPGSVTKVDALEPRTNQFRAMAFGSS